MGTKRPVDDKGGTKRIHRFARTMQLENEPPAPVRRINPKSEEGRRIAQQYQDPKPSEQ